MNQSNRKFVFGKLEIRKFIISDYLYLAAYIIGVVYYLFATKYTPENKFVTSWIVSFVVGFQTISSPFGLRFRNVYFSIIWLILSLILLIDNYFISLMPISTFILYHIIRLIFWKKNKREFIPYETGKGNMYRYKSSFEGKYGDLKDKKYTKILLRIGLLIIFLCFTQIIGLKV
ncbi:hypothetical protein J2Y38_001890 [Flavobacterium sp. 2755]|uniref:hypothetical protein n=1 Tax=Flavobacterium sp. 2755 TaxID=2817765 RepID=UPI0028655C56|nr:hypothetical protein [Flavobacterium sp. 2755]MDR6761681.1 hypothetical protein [Flavobacterium sp. 2755]